MSDSKTSAEEDWPGREYYDAIGLFIRRRVGNRDDARELVQEVYTRLAGQHPPIAACSVRAWLYRTARNCVVDLIRRPKMVSSDPTDGPLRELSVPNGMSVLEKNEEYQMILKTIGNLNAEYQEVLRLRFQESLSYDEIAEVVGVPKTTVAWRLHQALLLIRREMAVNSEKENR